MYLPWELKGSALVYHYETHHHHQQNVAVVSQVLILLSQNRTPYYTELNLAPVTYTLFFLTKDMSNLDQNSKV